jgi:hypothetical protein
MLNSCEFGYRLVLGVEKVGEFKENNAGPLMWE